MVVTLINNTHPRIGPCSNLKTLCVFSHCCSASEPVQHPDAARPVHGPPGFVPASRRADHGGPADRHAARGESQSLRVAGGGPGVRVLLMVSIIHCVAPIGFILFSHLQLQFKILELVTSASVELPSASPLFLHEDRPLRHVSQQLTQQQQPPPPPPPTRPHISLA